MRVCRSRHIYEYVYGRCVHMYDDACVCTRAGNARIQFTKAHAHKYTRAQMRFEFRKRQTISRWMQTLFNESAIFASCSSTAGSESSRNDREESCSNPKILKWITMLGVSSLSPIRGVLDFPQRETVTHLGLHVTVVVAVSPANCAPTHRRFSCEST